MSQAIADAVAAAAGGSLGSWKAVPGGDINAAMRVELTDGRALFAKHRADPPAGFYAAEAAGLRWLGETGALQVPEVVAADDRFLALTWIDTGPRADGFEATLGAGLAHLHAAGARHAGATADGVPAFLGPLLLPGNDARFGTDAGPGTDAPPGNDAGPGINAPPGNDARPGTDAGPGTNAPPGNDARPGTDAAPGTDAPPGIDARPGTDAAPGAHAACGTRPPPDWPHFYAHQRLAPLLRQAVDGDVVSHATARRVQRVIDGIDAFAGPPEPPARLHGDLWSGNVMAGPDGGPVLVDPAAYGGHREVDLAMLRLFGAPGPQLLEAYEAVHPLADGAEERVELWQLLPLLVHAVLFGGGYGAAVDRAARRYVH